MSADPRSRTKTWLDYYLDVTPDTATRLGNLLLDDAATAPTFLVQYAKPNYDLDRIMLPTTQGGKGYDLVYNVYTPESTPLHMWNHQTYGYIEKVQIEPVAMTKTGLTGTTLRWQAEQELRRITETYAGGSLGALRRFQRMSDSEEPLGALRLYGVKYELEYKRKNDNFTPTVPYFEYGTAWNYDGDRLAGGTEGTWAVSGAGATQAIDNGDFLALTRAGADASTVHGTNLNLSTTLYPVIRYRYKCSNANVVPTILVTFTSGSQTITLANSTTLITAVMPLTAAKTVNTVTLQSLTSDGTVYWDFVVIYEYGYILPNCIHINDPDELREGKLSPFGMSGSHKQAGGAELKKLIMTCDLDVEGATITWKRPQTGSPTDKTQTRVFRDISYEESRRLNNVPWHWLNWGEGAMKARLIRYEVDRFENNILTLEWEEYRNSSADVAHEDADSRFSINQVT
jgi:hypothetical protein